MSDRPILIPYDGSEHAKAAIEQAAEQLDHGRRAIILTVWQPSTRSSWAWASAAAEAATRQDRFWLMHDLLFHRQAALTDDDLRRYAAELDLDVALFDSDRESAAVMTRIGRDIESGLASGRVTGTPTLFVDGVLHQGGFDPQDLLEALGR